MPGFGDIFRKITRRSRNNEPAEPHSGEPEPSAIDPPGREADSFPAPSEPPPDVSRTPSVADPETDTIQPPSPSDDLPIDRPAQPAASQPAFDDPPAVSPVFPPVAEPPLNADDRPAVDPLNPPREGVHPGFDDRLGSDRFVPPAPEPPLNADDGPAVDPTIPFREGVHPGFDDRLGTDRFVPPAPEPPLNAADGPAVDPTIPFREGVHPGFDDRLGGVRFVPPAPEPQADFAQTVSDEGNVGVLDPPIIEVVDDDALVSDPLQLTCPYCGAESQRVGSRCSNARCNQVIVRLPGWAQHRRHNWLARRLSWRRIVVACLMALVIVFIIWVNYPFAPDPVVLFKKTQTQLTIDAGPGSWTSVGRDLRHSRRVDIGPPPPAGQIRYWNFDVPGDPLQSEPVAQDTHVYVGSSEGMFALSHADLSFIEKWEGETPGRVTGGAAVIGLYLFFGSTDHTLSSWNSFDGQVRWSFPAADIVESSPVVSDGVVYFSSGESWIYALDAHNGALIWKKQLDSNASGAPTVHEGKMYVGDQKGVFYVLSARTGQEWFRFRTPRGITGSPVVSEDGQKAYFTSGGHLYAVEATRREVPGLFQFKQLWSQLWLWQVPGVPRPKGQPGGLWRFTPENPLQGVKSSPALVTEEDGGSTLYVGGHDNNVYALDSTNGDLLWTFGTANAVWASPLVIKDHVLVGDEDGVLYSLNRHSGLENWRMNLGSPIKIPPIVSNGLLIVRTADGNVYGIE